MLRSRGAKSASTKPRDRRALRQMAMADAEVATDASDNQPLTTSATDAATAVIANMTEAKEQPTAGVAYREPVGNPLTGRASRQPKSAATYASPRLSDHALVGSPRRPADKSHRCGDGCPSLQMTRSRVLQPQASTPTASQWAADRITAEGSMTMEEWVSAKEAPASMHPAAAFGRLESVSRLHLTPHGGGGLNGHDLPATDEERSAPAAGLATVYVHHGTNPITWQPSPRGVRAVDIA